MSTSLDSRSFPPTDTFYNALNVNDSRIFRNSAAAGKLFGQKGPLIAHASSRYSPDVAELKIWLELYFSTKAGNIFQFQLPLPLKPIERKVVFTAVVPTLNLGVLYPSNTVLNRRVIESNTIQKTEAVVSFDGPQIPPPGVMELIPRVPLILGRPFLRTARALIDVHGEKMTLRHDDQSVTFKVGIDDAECDPEKDILLLEAILNSEPLSPLPNHANYVPGVRKELKICEAKTNETSIDEPSEVELKDLPPHLEYAFLEGNTSYQVSFAKDLSVGEKAAS
ncbi:hypothetical protein Tco_0856053 [Tanacetum coccineum]